MIPENGASIDSLASFAWARASDASATLRLFSASSLAWPEMNPLPCRSMARSYFAFAKVILACACCSSARVTDGSSFTSGAPLATRSPSRNWIALMRPATSGRNVIDSSERRLPTAVMPCGIASLFTWTASTATAGAAAATDAAGAADDLDASPGRPNQKPTAPATTMRIAATPITALFMRDGGRQSRKRQQIIMRRWEQHGKSGSGLAARISLRIRAELTCLLPFSSPGSCLPC